jgi:hypothetical protein
MRRSMIAKLRSANPVWFVGVALVATAYGLAAGVSLHALPTVVAEIVGWF